MNFQGIIAPYMNPIEGRPLDNIRVQVLRRSDDGGRLQPIPGFTLEESDPMYGDGLATEVKWKGKSDLTSLRGSAVSIRMHIVNSQLWGIRFSE